MPQARITRQEALDYHTRNRPGKIEIKVTKPCFSQGELSLAYSPGVAEPVREIVRNPDDAFRYTARANLVAVISNGTAVLGLGNVGPLAAKPVMEGKGVLFKRFADIDVFDLEIDATDPDEVVRVISALEPTFGAINLEDFKAPECFEIERRLKEKMSIPVFHDDQHGTAIISGAALLNALELVGKRIDAVRVVVSGAGAAAVACSEFFILLGLRPENLLMVDSKGVIHEGREEGMNEYKRRFARPTEARTLVEALRGADVFLGLSSGNLLRGEDLAVMADKPIIFALANPDPEIPYDEARRARPDAIVATGRSDYPNQVNNVLGFPFIFRGALDVRARAINDEMKVAAARAIAALAKEDVPDSVLRAYGVESLHFGPEYIIPKPLDPRALLWIAPAVAEAAMKSGVARLEINVEEYRERLAARQGKAREVKRLILNKAKAAPKRVVFAEGEEVKIIRAAVIVKEEGIAHPILLGNKAVVDARLRELGLEAELDVVSPLGFARLEEYARALYQKRQRKGITLDKARALVRQHNYFGPMMVEMGDADAYVAGLTYHYPEVLRPALQVVGVDGGLGPAGPAAVREGAVANQSPAPPDSSRPGRVAGLYIMIVGEKVYFFTDATVNIEPTAEDLADIAILAAERARTLGVEPRIAMLSFSNFGSTRHPLSEKVRRATEIVKARRPDLMVDGEMQADTAVVPEIRETDYPFSTLKGEANILVFPSLDAANIGYKLMQRLGGAEAIGPVLLGASHSIHVLQRGDEVDDIVNIAAIAVIDAQDLESRRRG